MNDEEKVPAGYSLVKTEQLTELMQKNDAYRSEIEKNSKRDRKIFTVISKVKKIIPLTEEGFDATQIFNVIGAIKDDPNLLQEMQETFAFAEDYLKTHPETK